MAQGRLVQQAQAGHKRGVRAGEADSGTMEAQGASLHGGRWALLLLLLGLATPLATAQVLSQEEAALLAVEEFNRNSSEESLYRLLQLDQQPDGVSGGSGGGSALLRSATPLGFCWASSERRPSLSAGSCLSQETFPELCPLPDGSFLP